MEVAGLAISVVGLVALCDTCVTLIERVESFHRFEKEKTPLLHQLRANRLILQDWSRQVGISRDGDSEKVHPALDDEHRETVAGLLSRLRHVLSTSVPAGFRQDLDSQSVSIDLAAVSNPNKQTDTYSVSEASGRLPHPIRRRDRFKWAIGKDKSKLQERVKESTALIEQLRQLVPPEDYPRSSRFKPFSSDPRRCPWQSQSDNYGRSSDDWPEVISKTFDGLSRYDRRKPEALKVSDKGRIRKWLSVVPFEDLYQKRLSERQPGTCTWIEKHGDYKQWVSTNDSATKPRLLWLCGPGGGGKSVLCASMVDNLLSEGANLGHFFCTTNNEQQRDVTAIINTFIWQLADLSDVVLNDLMTWYESDWSRSPTENEQWQFFRVALDRIDAPILVIDGFDECGKKSVDWKEGSRSVRTAFLSRLIDCIGDRNVRVMIFSRDEADIREGMSRCQDEGVALYKRKITTPDVQSDLTLFARSTVQKRLQGQPDDIQEDITQRMIAKSAGMFLSIKLLGSNLRNTMGEAQLIRTVEETPQEIENVFSRDWEQIQQLEPYDKERATLILLWLVYAVQPLTAAELIEALAISDEAAQTDRLDDEYIRKEVLGLCGSIITAEETSGQLSGSSIVTFSHFSAKRFALKVLPDTSASDTRPLNECLLARSCLTYLMRSQTWQHTKTSGITTSPPAFLKYAVENWHRHLTKACRNDSSMTDSVNAFFSSENELWPKWRDEYEAIQRRELEGLCTRSYNPGGREYYSASFGLLPTMDCIDKEQDCDWNCEGGIWGSPLQVASRFSCQEAIEFLLKRHVDVNRRGGLSGSPLNAAAALSTYDMILKLIDSGADPQVRSDYGEVALHHAARAQNVETIQLLLDRGADIGAVSTYGMTASHLAAHAGNAGVLHLLLDRGAVVDATDQDGNTPLFMAANGGSVEATELLLNKSASVNHTNKPGYTPLHVAAAAGQVKVVRLLLTRGAAVDHADEDGGTPLHTAAAAGQVEVVRLLLARGAAVDYADEDGGTPLHKAAGAGQVEVMRLLLAGGAAVDHADEDGSTPLHTAAVVGKIEVARLLLDRGADINSTASNGRTALHSAAGNGDLKMVQLLLDEGADVGVACNDGSTLLHFATLNGHLEIVRLLLDLKIDVNATSDLGGTAIVYAASNGHVEIVQEFVDRGVVLNDKKSQLSEALQRASDYGHAKVIKCLLAYSDDTDSPGAEEKIGKDFLLRRAIEFGHIEIIDLLVARGYKISSTDRIGRTALHTPVHEDSLKFLEGQEHVTNVAGQVDHLGCDILHYIARGSSIEAVNWAIAAGNDLNKPDNQGWTPLHWAAYFGHAATVSHLLRLGASALTRDSEDRSPYMIAVSVGAGKAVSELLKQSEQLTDETSCSILKKAGTAWCDICLHYLYGHYFRCKPCGFFDLCFRCFLDRDIVHPGSCKFEEMAPESSD